MVKVRVLGLRGCNHCKALLEELGKLDIKYTLLDANEHGALADKVEEFLGVENYPITIIDAYNTTYYIYGGDTYESLNEVVTGKVVKKGCASTHGMAEYIKKLLY